MLLVTPSIQNFAIFPTSIYSQALCNKNYHFHYKGKPQDCRHKAWHILDLTPICYKGFTPLNPGFTIKHDKLKMKSHLFKVSCLLIPMLVGTRTSLPQIICWLTRSERQVRFYLTLITKFHILPHCYLRFPQRSQKKSTTYSHSKYFLLKLHPTL